ncbi:hypothetical protein [Sphingomonas sp. PWP1-2]|uniref:hypothetical protein n=1 Tax=Sphingomonas sp. PWP1-2 TaxID=2804558 RepID=UPI003CEDE55D
MSARIYWGAAWKRARDLRASRGKAPRLAVRRAILLRQGANGSWIVGIHEWRFGIWKPPTWLCGWSTLPDARKAALDAWDQHRLPLLWAYHGERNMRPFFRNLNEPPIHAAARSSDNTIERAA